MGCLNGHALDQVVYAKETENEQMSNLAAILYYLLLVFELCYREPMGKCCFREKNIIHISIECQMV